MSDTPMFPNWFDGAARPNFEEHLTEFKGKPNLKFLQVGAYTGDATVWMLDNILTDPTSTLTDIDTWQGSDEQEHKSMNFNDVFDVYLVRTNDYKNLLTIRSKSEYALANLDPGYDFIYVDGDHTAAGVRIDSYHAHRLLKSGGVLAFDDYEWGDRDNPALTPKPAIDRFLEIHNDEYDKLTVGWQVWLRKK